MKKSNRTKEKQKQAAPAPRIGLSLAEAEARTGVSRYTLRRMITAGTLKAARFGRRIVISTAELETLLNAGAIAARQ
jgi:excisionase family DNA binding protein